MYCMSDNTDVHESVAVAVAPVVETWPLNKSQYP